MSRGKKFSVKKCGYLGKKAFRPEEISHRSLGEEAFRAEEMGQYLEGHRPDHHRVPTPYVKACSNSLDLFLSPSVSFPSVCLGVS